jgi:putative restriction endonuclease
MREKINQEQRAFSAWTILTKSAKNSEPITYGELARQLNLHHRAIRFILGVIQDYCMRNELPPLTIIVLNKNTGLPGDGFIAYDIENSQDGMNKVYAYEWTKLTNPFEYAQIGTTENQLIDELVNSPQNSADIFAKVKVRGISQRIFRQALLKVYDCSCAVCGFSFEEALEASHIIPYSQGNADQRLDVRNGLLLCSTHHKLFDNGFITINQDYTIKYFDNEETIGEYSKYDKLMTSNLHLQKINLPKDIKHLPNKEYLEQHQNSE